jgi:hypothetical protein
LYRLQWCPEKETVPLKSQAHSPRPDLEGSVQAVDLAGYEA